MQEYLDLISDLKNLLLIKKSLFLKKEKKNQEPPPPPKIEKAPIKKELKSTIASLFPELKILDEIPKETFQRKALIFFIAEKRYAAFSENIVKALENIAPSMALFLEDKQDWEKLFSQKTLRLILLTESSIPLPFLKLLKQVPSKEEWFVGDIPLYKLPSLDTYLKNPLKKLLLWQRIKELCTLK